MTLDSTNKFKKARTDIDIDVKNSKEVIEKLPCIKSLEKINNDELIAHKSGIHFDAIPIDPITGISSIEYKEAERLGYQKIDILSNSAYKYVEDRKHLKELSEIEPDWSKLLDPDILSQLAQINNQATLINVWKPSSIDELAMFLAMIRPGKKNCQSMMTWDEVRRDIWNYSNIGNDAYGNKLRYFKKPHAYAYSLMIVVQLNSISSLM